MSRLSRQCCKYFSSTGALKTDHTEVLLSADFTGAIKVFINVKKYWALEMVSAPHIRACLLRISLKDEGQPVRGLLTSPNYLMVNSLRRRAVCSVCSRTGTLTWKIRELVNNGKKQTRCDSLSRFYFLSSIPSNCEEFGIRWTSRKCQVCMVWAETKSAQICMCVNLRLCNRDGV